LSVVEIPPLDRYVRLANICDSLAVLASQGTMIEFLQRLSVLIKLKNCWMKGHCDVVLHCSSDDDSHDNTCHLSQQQAAYDTELSQPDNQGMTGNVCDSEGECWTSLYVTTLTHTHGPNCRYDRYLCHW